MVPRGYTVTKLGKAYLSRQQREAAAHAEHAAQQQRVANGTETRSFRDLFGDDPFGEQPKERRVPLVGGLLG